MSTVQDSKDSSLFAQKAELERPLKVSELVALLKRDIEREHRSVRVVGEIASFKPWHSGHWYFDIKDESALIPAVMFKSHVARVPFKVTEGQEILFTGRVSIYQANARLQMVVEGMEPLGQGALALAFLQLKERLLKEGLFDEKLKKNLRLLNKRIGIITSSHGAALRDMVRIITSRLPNAHIMLIPVRVQGAHAKEEIAEAISVLDKEGYCDVIIVGRGGGSIEDLWAFNEEIVARAIFAAKTPIISAVGHETDTTISDFVADVRASTPTHGAMLAAASIEEISSLLGQREQALTQFFRAKLHSAYLVIAQNKKSLGDPRILLFKHWQGLDDSERRLTNLVSTKLKDMSTMLKMLDAKLKALAPWRMVRGKRDMLFKLSTKLYEYSPQKDIAKRKLELSFIKERLDDLFRAQIKRKREQFIHYVEQLEALSALSVLRRGFSLISDTSGRVIKSKDEININDEIIIRMQDGAISALITKKE